MSLKYIDIHTHHHSGLNTLGLLNLFAHESVTDNFNNFQYYSIGLHPWYIDNETSQMFEKNIRNNLVHPNIIAIGETGIDRAIETPLELQQEVFEKHISISEEHKLPLVIHCVRAYNDLLYIRNKIKVTMPWIIHAYNGNPEITTQLLRHNFYFSFGEALFKPTEKLKASLKLIPKEKLFLETDETGYEIAQVYNKFCELIKMDIQQLMKIILQNFESCLGKRISYE